MSVYWWEIAVNCNTQLEETVYWRLDNFGCSGTAVEIRDGLCIIKAYIAQIKVESDAIVALADLLKQDAISLNLDNQLEVSWSTVEEQDWANSWKQYWHPTPIGLELIVYPAWLTPPQDTKEIILRLDPGSAFGTGTHPTTQLCLESLTTLLLDHPETMVIADIGCGSGILSIGSLLLGAGKVYAVDTDILAVNATKSNAELNLIAPDSLHVDLGSAADLVKMLPQGVDGIVCNILADVLIDLMGELFQLSKPKSWAVLSGLLINQAEQVSQSAKENGYLVTAIGQKDPWCCLELYRVA
ncbi:MAG: 50S ribosomal protein L11 methyltransferase [Cyanobacteriota bacterium ELA615]